MTVRKIVLFFLAVALLISMVPAACADGGGEYVLLRSTEGNNFQYKSPYTLDNYYYNDEQQIWLNVGLYSMQNTVNSEIFPTYCVDIITGAYRGHYYRRVNLEDSTYSGSVGGKLRAIVQNGFYINPNNYSSDADHEAAVKAKVAALGAAAHVENLTLGEAISATQAAIWKTAHGAVLDFGNFVRQSVDKSMNSVRYGTMCKAELLDSYGTSYISTLDAARLKSVNSRITQVYDYLLALDPVGPSHKAVSASSFTKVNDPEFVLDEDGTYTVTITTEVDVDLFAGDSLTLTASVGGKKATAAVSNGRHDYTLTISGVDAAANGSDVKLSLSGQQEGNDVYLYDAYGDRGTAQTMVGMDNSALPVYAEITAQDNRILNITKTTGSGQPLKGIIFDIYRVEGEVDLTKPEEYKPTGLAEYTVITNESGYASLNFTQHGLPDGLYLVVERDHPAIVRPIDPFFVIIPTINEEGTNYEISVYPKNEVKGDIKVEKDVISLGNDSASVNAGTDHTWIISASIPEDIAQGSSYVISDTLDNRLDYVGNFRAAVEATESQEVAADLIEGEDYTLTVNDVDSLGEGKPQDSFSMQLTAGGMGKVAAAVGAANTSNYKIRVYFDTKINGNAEAAVEIPNQSVVNYTNSLDFNFTARSDEPVVYTGAANLLKIDAADPERKLAGAEFEVYRPATPEEIGNNAEGVTSIEGVTEKVVKVSFYDNADMNGEKVASAVTNEEGRLTVYGLAYGKYYLLETKAPEGYNPMKEAKELVIDAQSHTEEKIVTVTNTKGTLMPETGGIGTEVFVFSGTLLMAVSLLMLLDQKRRKVN